MSRRVVGPDAESREDFFEGRFRRYTVTIIKTAEISATPGRDPRERPDDGAKPFPDSKPEIE